MQTAQAKSPLIGFGDPVFNTEEESKSGAQDRAVVAHGAHCCRSSKLKESAQPSLGPQRAL
jgi:hypothetical protein